MSKKPLTGNSADPEQVADAGRKESVAADTQAGDLRAVLSTAEGRRFVWGLLTFTGVFKTSFTGNSETFYREGQRNVGLKIIADLRAACPERLVEMMTSTD